MKLGINREKVPLFHSRIMILFSFCHIKNNKIYRHRKHNLTHHRVRRLINKNTSYDVL